MRTTKVRPHVRSMNLKSAEQMLKREEKYPIRRAQSFKKFTPDNLKAKKYEPNWIKNDPKFFTKERMQEQYKSHFMFSRLEPENAEKLFGKEKGMLDPDEGQNESPTPRELVELARTHHGFVGGYVIPTESGREDARVSIDTIYLPEKEAHLYKKIWDANGHPVDEFGPQDSPKGYMRIWWD